MSIKTTDPKLSFAGKSGRRGFLAQTLAAIAGISLLPLKGLPHGISSVGSSASLTIQQVIDRILAEIPGTPFKQTVDTIKAGDPEQPVKGIVTTMFATDAVITGTIRLGANFIIAHEPTYYNHLDQTDWLRDDKVYRFKKDLLDKHGIVVWRFHDSWHSHHPDGILMGVLVSMGWDKYYDPSKPKVLNIPAVSLGEVIKTAKQGLGIEKVKVIGDLSQVCKRILLMPGASGGTAQINGIREEEPDLMICGELNEWETSEYIRDLRYQGGKTALMDLGHSVSEEPGMEWLVSWLEPKVPGVKITHIPSGDAFMFV